MTPEAARAMYRRMLARSGESVTLSRGTASITVKGKLFPATPDELIDVQDQSAQKLLILAQPLELAGWPVPPRKGDRVTFGGRTLFVDAVDLSRRIQGEQIAYDLTVVG